MVGENDSEILYTFVVAVITPGRSAQMQDPGGSFTESSPPGASRRPGSSHDPGGSLTRSSLQIWRDPPRSSPDPPGSHITRTSPRTCKVRYSVARVRPAVGFGCRVYTISRVAISTITL